jgi:hypothetical protein
MTPEASVHAVHLRMIAPAQALGNLSQASRELGVSPARYSARGDPARLSALLARPDHGSLSLAPATVYRFLRRLGLQTRQRPLAVLEVLEVRRVHQAGLLTERTRQALARARHRRSADLACSFAIAQVNTEFSPRRRPAS